MSVESHDEVARGARPARSPWAFVPALYFLQGLPYVLVQTVSTTFFARMLVPIDVIGHWSSLLTLPWMLKPLWSPLVDLVGTKRGWVIAMQLAICVSLFGLAFSATSADVVVWSIVACALVACASATHDIAADGFYLLALDTRAQAGFVGIRSAAFRLAMIFGSGAVVYLAGWFADADPARASDAQASIPRAWMLALGAAALVYLAGALANALLLPHPAADVRRARAQPLASTPGASSESAASVAAPRTERAPFVEALVSYFRQPRIVAIVAFILLYRFGESMLTKMAPAFLITRRAQGGLELSDRDVGFVLGTVGVSALILGGVLGGALIARFGLKRCLWPMVLALHLPNLFYVWAAVEQPGRDAIGVVIAVEQFGYGFGFAAYMVFLMQVSRGHRFQTTHYAISTGLMGLGALLAGYPSGTIVASLGFVRFFWCVCALTIPGMITLFFIPLERERPVSGR